MTKSVPHSSAWAAWAAATCRPQCARTTWNLWPFVKDRFTKYIGVDVLKYDGFPEAGEFHKIDLDTGRATLSDGVAEVVVGVETIEHLENPRAFARELNRLCRPGGWIIITTPNQLSFLSKLTLLLKNEFNAFQASSYPAHITALLEVDLRRIATECAGPTNSDIQLRTERRCAPVCPARSQDWPA